MKNTPPKMVNAQGLTATKSFPKMPNTPKIKAIIPPIVNIIAKTRIMFNNLKVTKQNYKFVYKLDYNILKENIIISILGV